MRGMSWSCQQTVPCVRHSPCERRPAGEVPATVEGTIKGLVRAASAWDEDWWTHWRTETVRRRFADTVRRRFADEAAECAAHGRWAQVPPVDVPCVWAFVAFAQEGVLAPRAHLAQAA